MVLEKMYTTLKSRIINNGIVFLIWMSLAFFVFISFFGNNNITASISDSFVSESIGKNFDFHTIKEDDNYVIQSLKNFESWTSKSINITLLYNKEIKDIIINSLKSKFKFSLFERENSVVVFFDLVNQDIKFWEQLLYLSLDNINDKNIPIIDSILLYEDDTVNNLSINSNYSSDYH